MKPEDLKPPCPREDQRTIIHDRVWYIPRKQNRSQKFIFPGWEHPDLFGNTLPVIVEYCSGNGAWIADKAQTNPHLNWVAVEMKFERVKKIWSKIKNFQLHNLIVICGEATMATADFFPNETISDVYINFPDPWPKRRHFKNRLIQLAFTDQLYRILKNGKFLRFVTDDVSYSDWLVEVMRNYKDFASIYPYPFYLVDDADYGTSYFDQLWRSKGRSIRYHCFQKQKLLCV